MHGASTYDTVHRASKSVEPLVCEDKTSIVTCPNRKGVSLNSYSANRVTALLNVSKYIIHSHRHDPKNRLA